MPEEGETRGVPDRLADLSSAIVEANKGQVKTVELDAGERAATAVAEERGIQMLEEQQRNERTL